MHIEVYMDDLKELVEGVPRRLQNTARGRMEMVRLKLKATIHSLKKEHGRERSASEYADHILWQLSLASCES